MNNPSLDKNDDDGFYCIYVDILDVEQFQNLLASIMNPIVLKIPLLIWLRINNKYIISCNYNICDIISS
jgi:hypothetical protein